MKSQMEDPLVSVIVPAYNAARYIHECVTSVLSQPLETLEVFVIDDGSTDNTSEVVGSIVDPRLHLVPTPNRGVSAARNLGLEKATGIFTAFLDADDYWLAAKIEKQLAFLRTRDDVCAVGCLMNYVSPSGRKMGVAGRDVSREDQVLIAQAREMPFPISSILFRREDVIRAGGFDEELTSPVEDLDLLSRLATTAKIACIPEILGAYRIHPTSASVTRFHDQRMATRYLRARRHAEAAGEPPILWDEFARQYRPTLRQRYGDVIMSSYRKTAIHAAEGNWLRAAALGVPTLILAPRYSLTRLRQQRPWRELFGKRAA